VSLDLELNAWRRDWSVDTEPLPELKRRVRAQDRRLGIGAVVLVACLAAGAALGLSQPFDSWWGGFAVGLWGACTLGVVTVLWVRRGTWRPAAETTDAYLTLLHRRAIAQVRKIVIFRRAMLVTVLGYAAFLAWHPHLTVASGFVMLGLVAEMFWLRSVERRRRRDVEDAAALMDRTLDGAADSERTK
jgi:hypothetical protein